jgi:hypothetical protein
VTSQNHVGRYTEIEAVRKLEVAILLNKRTSSYACTEPFKFDLVMIFEGPFTPNRVVVVTFVASEKVGEGGPGDVVRREPKDRPRSDLAAMAGTRQGLRNFELLWVSIFVCSGFIMMQVLPSPL